VLNLCKSIAVLFLRNHTLIKHASLMTIIPCFDRMFFEVSERSYAVMPLDVLGRTVRNYSILFPPTSPLFSEH
jgi:hypothetical protein